MTITPIPYKTTAGFGPADNSFADCPLEPLEYVVIATAAGFEPATS